MSRRVRCLYCGRLFYPDPRCKNPKACSNAKCQRRRKNSSHKRWRDKAPDVLSDRRADCKKWRQTHPEYMRSYRASHPEYVAQNRRMQRKRYIAKRVVKSISISPQVLDKYDELSRSLFVVKSTSIAKGSIFKLSGVP